jgi:hypothetical protein
MGVVIESAVLAMRLSESLDSGLPHDAYVNAEKRHTSEPGAGWLQRRWIGFLAIRRSSGCSRT